MLPSQSRKLNVHPSTAKSPVFLRSPRDNQDLIYEPVSRRNKDIRLVHLQRSKRHTYLELSSLWSMDLSQVESRWITPKRINGEFFAQLNSETRVRFNHELGLTRLFFFVCVEIASAFISNELRSYIYEYKRGRNSAEQLQLARNLLANLIPLHSGQLSDISRT